MCQTVGGAQMSWRHPCLPGEAEGKMEEGERLASSAGVAERRRSKGSWRVGQRLCRVLMLPVTFESHREGFLWCLSQAFPVVESP